MANKYQLVVAPTVTVDGSGLVSLEIRAVTTGDAPIPDRHVNVTVSEERLVTALAAGDNQAIKQALKAMIAASLPVGWSDESLSDVVRENAAAVAAADALDDHITVTLEQTYPVSFALD